MADTKAVHFTRDAFNTVAIIVGAEYARLKVNEVAAEVEIGNPYFKLGITKGEANKRKTADKEALRGVTEALVAMDVNLAQPDPTLIVKTCKVAGINREHTRRDIPGSQEEAKRLYHYILQQCSGGY